MIITHVTLKNWRNFRSIDVDLSERVFLAGPNASGKSNFLDVFRFLHDIAKPGGGLQKSVSDRGGLSKLRCLAAREHPDVEVVVRLSDEGNHGKTWRYAIGIKQQARGHRQPYLTYERVFHRDEEILNRPDSDDKTDPLRLTQTHLEQIGANSGFRDVAKFFESILYLHLVPQLVRRPEVFSSPGNTEDPFGWSFLDRVVKTPQKVRRSRLRKIEQALVRAVPQIKGLTDVKDESGIPHLEAVYEHWRPRGAKQREDQFSDGTLRLIGLLWSLLESESLLLLEEPELSLNSGIVRKLPSIIHRVQRQKKRQIILSTHSVDMLSDLGIGGEEVLLLTPSAEGTRMDSVSSIKHVRSLLESGMSIAEAALPLTEPPKVQQLDLFE
jgi:predicted ATPase